MRFCAAVFGLASVVAACATSAPEPTRTTSQAIVGGIPSTPTQDATVLLNDAGRNEGCSGTLIAPNLVLTARHCVTEYNHDDECGFPLGRDLPASLFTISVGVYANPQQVVARGAMLHVPYASHGVCGADIALLLLDKDVPNAKTARVRFAPPALDETATAIGYGDGYGRREREVNVLALGPADTTYTTYDGQRLQMFLPANDYATSESTCFGDSGGPLLDAEGQVIGVASRGIDYNCVDRPSVWTGLAPHKQLILDAANVAGHPLETPPKEGSGAGGGSETSSSSGTVGGSKGAKMPGDKAPRVEDSDQEDPKQPRSPGVASAGCSMLGNTSYAGLPETLLLLAAASAARVRRRSQSSLAR